MHDCTSANTVSFCIPIVSFGANLPVRSDTETVKVEAYTTGFARYQTNPVTLSVPSINEKLGITEPKKKLDKKKKVNKIERETMETDELEYADNQEQLKKKTRGRPKKLDKSS